MSLDIEQILKDLRAERDLLPKGDLRTAYNDACDRLDALLSRRIDFNLALLTPGGIVELNLSDRALKPLIDFGITTIEQITQIGALRLSDRVPGIGRMIANEIRGRLEERAVSLSESAARYPPPQ